jgi:phosphomannomutase/phosphoglucomutase
LCRKGGTVIAIPEAIFREYDIRGVVGEDLTADRVRDIGSAVAVTLARDGVSSAVVGRDNRLSGEEFSEALIDGLTAHGIDVVNIGVVPTPVFYFAAKKWGIRGGVMITASHNPAEFNGFKVLRGEGTIYGAAIHELWEIASSGPLSDGGAKVENRDANSEYIDYVTANIAVRRPVRFAADGGNGTAGIVAAGLFRRLGCDPVELYMEPDGTYPNHHPDPTVPENLVDLRNAVLDGKLEFGVGFDGDSDRIGVIDDRGDVLWGDRLLALFARNVIAEHPGAAVIFEVKCSQGLEEDIRRHGGKPIMWKTGHSLIKQKMRDENALLAGEMSGHLFFADRYFGFDDAIYAACRLLEIVSAEERPLSSLLEDFPRYESTPEIRVACEDDRKFDVVREVRDYFKENHKVIDIDGARIQFEDGWGLIRASNTQPVLVLRFEAETKDSLRAIRDEVARALEKHVDVTGILGE